MNLLAELSSAGAPATAPAVAGERAGNAPAPVRNSFADMLGMARGMPAGPAEHGAGAAAGTAAGSRPTSTDEQLHGTADGGNPETEDTHQAGVALLAGAGTPAAAPGMGSVPQGAAARFAGLPDTSANGKPLPPGIPHSGNPLPPQAGPDMEPGSHTGQRQTAMVWSLPANAGPGAGAEPGAGAVAALRSDAAQSLMEERNPAQRSPGGLERPGEAGNLLRNLAGAENLRDVAVTVRPGAMPPAESAATVVDPRAMLEATARQQRTALAQTAGPETVERTAPGLESVEPAARPVVARPVAPTLLARDMSALAERVEVLAQRPGGTASVNVSLGDLGNVEISVRMEARQAHVQFVVQDAMTREALESQLPRLRAMLEESGLKLGDVNTGLPGKSERDADGGQPSGQTGTTTAAYEDRELPVDDRLTHASTAASSHLLDAFA